MSIIDTYKERLRAMEKLQKELEAMEQSKELQADLAFSNAIDELLKETGLTQAQALAIIVPKETAAPKPSQKGTRTRRSIERLVRNPHTGEEVMVATRANPIVKGWIKQYGKEKVDSWYVS